MDTTDLFSLCFSMNPIPAVISTIKEGIVVDVNEAFLKLAGYSRDEVIGKPLSENRFWSNKVQRAEILKEIREKGPLRNRELKFGDALGKVHDCLVYMEVIEYQGASHLLSMAIDITERKKKEDAFHLAESRYRAIVENTLNGVAIFRALHGGEDFEYLEFNKAAEQIDGISKDEVIGTTLHQTFPGSRESGLYDALQRVWRTGTGEYLPVYFYRDGRISGWRESFVYKLPSGELVEVYSDQTARVKAEKELLEHRRELFTLISNLPGIVYRCRNDAERTMESVSQGCYKLTGYTQDELIGNRRVSYGQIIHPEDRETVWAQIQNALEERDHFQLVYRVITEKSELKWVWEQGIGVFTLGEGLLFLEGFVVDISVHKRTQEELKISEEKFTKVFHASPDWVSITTLDKGIYIDVNEGYLYWSGYSRDEVVGHTSLEIEIWERPEDRKRVIGKLKEQGRVRNEEVKFRTKAGRLRTVLWSAVTITLGDQECILGLGRDITEYKYLEGELLRAQKMEAVGRLAGSIAHDFNNYLAAIEGFSELVLLKIGNAEAVTKNIGKIRDVKNSASSLIRQLLSFSKKQPTKPTAVDLNEVIEGMRELLVPVIGSKINLKLILDKKKCLVLGDRSQLEQVVMNLSLNASDAMPKGGTFTIATAHVRIDNQSTGRYVELKSGEYVQLIMNDTGMGMDEETASHIFEPYFTTKADSKGSGLGLTSVYSIVKQFDGSIRLRTEPGKGAIFTILLPAYKEKDKSTA
ncbi:MAG: PAS domain S-box protein [Desulfomonilia bacterium]|jgi:PAS domain S-box-containing protein